MDIFLKKLQQVAKNKEGGVFALCCGFSEMPYLLDQMKPLFENIIFTTVENLQKELIQELFFSYKFIVVQEVSKATKAQKESLIDLQPEGQCVLLCFEDALLAMDKKILKHATVLNFFGEKPWDRHGRFLKIAKLAFQKEGKTIRPDLLERLTKTFEDLAIVLKEIEKLICFVGDREEIQDQDLDAILSTNDTHNAWKFSAYFLEKNHVFLMRLVFDLAQDEQSLIGLIYQIRYQITQLCEMKSHLQKDNRLEIFRKKFNNLSHHRAKGIIENLQHFTQQELDERLIKLLDFEFFFKNHPKIQDKTTLACLLIEG
ncbi:MAG: hypothetical protein K940chlam8_00091 [Chlamydiae bacterium]|nr:hypothetical protein [Chlamydiota bacterium]